MLDALENRNALQRMQYCCCSFFWSTAANTVQPIFYKHVDDRLTRNDTRLAKCAWASLQLSTAPSRTPFCAISHHSFNIWKSIDTRLCWFSFAWFSPKQWIPQTPRTRVGMLHCDSSIWTRHMDLLMITEQGSLSQGPSVALLNTDQCLLCF